MTFSYNDRHLSLYENVRGPAGSRTPDLSRARGARYQLRHKPKAEAHPRNVAEVGLPVFQCPHPLGVEAGRSSAY